MTQFLPDWIDSPGAVLIRSVTLDVADVDARAGKVHGTVVPYEERVELAPGIFEEFAKGAFARQVEAPDSWGRVKLMVGHDHTKVPLGKAERLAERADGLEADFQLNMKMVRETERAREAWLALENGDLDEFSVGFRSVTREGTQQTNLRNSGVLLRRLRAHLAEVSLVPFGAYGRSAKVLAVRSDDTPVDPWAAERSRLAALRSTIRP